jgi:hypothetical protein
MMFELAWNQYHKNYRFTLKNLENKRYVKIFLKQFPRDVTKKKNSNTSCTISKSLRYISFRSKYKHLFWRCVVAKLKIKSQTLYHEIWNTKINKHKGELMKL